MNCSYEYVYSAVSDLNTCYTFKDFKDFRGERIRHISFILISNVFYCNFLNTAACICCQVSPVNEFCLPMKPDVIKPALPDIMLLRQECVSVAKEKKRRPWTVHEYCR